MELFAKKPSYAWVKLYNFLPPELKRKSPQASEEAINYLNTQSTAWMDSKLVTWAFIYILEGILLTLLADLINFNLNVFVLFN